MWCLAATVALVPVSTCQISGSNGFAINGIGAATARFRSAAPGTSNYDGFDDLIIGVRYADPTVILLAQALVMWCLQQQWLCFWPGDPSALNGSNNGFMINGIGWRHSQAGRSAAPNNGDGFDDLIIGQPRPTPNGITNAGQSYKVVWSGERLQLINPPWPIMTALPRLKILPSPLRLQLVSHPYRCHGDSSIDGGRVILSMAAASMGNVIFTPALNPLTG